MSMCWTCSQQRHRVPGTPWLRAQSGIFRTHPNPDVPMMAGNPRVNMHTECRCVGQCEPLISGFWASSVETSPHSPCLRGFPAITSSCDRTTPEWTARRAISAAPFFLPTVFCRAKYGRKQPSHREFRAQGVVFEFKRMVVCPSTRC